MLLHFVSSDFEIRLEETEVNEEKWQTQYIISHLIKQLVWRQTRLPQSMRVHLCTWAKNILQCMVLPIMCVLEPIVCICVRVFLHGKRRHWINGVEIKKDKSSVFSVWPWVYTTTTTWECNWTASGDAENKTMSHSSELQSCCKFYLNSIRKQCWRNIPLNYNLLWRFISGSVIEHALPFSLGEKMKRHSLFSLTLLVLVSSARSKVRVRCSRSAAQHKCHSWTREQTRGWKQFHCYLFFMTLCGLLSSGTKHHMNTEKCLLLSKLSP